MTTHTNPNQNNPSFCTDLGNGYWKVDNITVHLSQLTPEQRASFLRNCGTAVERTPGTNLIREGTRMSNGFPTNFLQVMEGR